MAEELLRYTSRGVVGIARRCGFVSRTNLYFAYQCDIRTTHSNSREQLMQQGEKDGYIIE
jgi:transcriptional regulator GlxA family with amidase domain